MTRHDTTHTLRIILDSGQLGTRPKTLRGVEEAGLRGRDEADDERAVRRSGVEFGMGDFSCG